MTSEHGPLLCLRMRATRSCTVESDNDDIAGRVSVMLQQEASTYRCRDYLRRRSRDKDEPDSVASNTTLIPVDTLSREKMVDWMYRIVDHFHASREIVTIAISYLDRFVDKCSCDRAAFKLAAMTSLYIATKLFSGKGISMTSLAELSRGEFDMDHISEMEGVVLQSLAWRLHPPTIQCFIFQFETLLPFTKGPITRAINQRAAFFAELAVFDYSFVNQPRSLVAVAAILNAMEGMEPSVASLDDQIKFVKVLRSSLQLEHTQEAIELTRNRLWYIYSQSAQYHEDDVLPAQQIEKQLEDLVIKKDPSDVELSQSPVSVSLVERC